MSNQQETFENPKITLSLYGYLHQYRFHLEEYLKRGEEEFDFRIIKMSDQTKIRIEEEISRIDLVISSYINYKRNYDL